MAPKVRRYGIIESRVEQRRGKIGISEHAIFDDLMLGKAKASVDVKKPPISRFCGTFMPLVQIYPMEALVCTCTQAELKFMC